MTNGTVDARLYQQHLVDYLEDSANEPNLDKPAGGVVVKGYVLDPDEATDGAVIGIVERRFRRVRNLAA